MLTKRWAERIVDEFWACDMVLKKCDNLTKSKSRLMIFRKEYGRGSLFSHFFADI